jgi:hypothetical protein
VLSDTIHFMVAAARRRAKRAAAEAAAAEATAEDASATESDATVSLNQQQQMAPAEQDCVFSSTLDEDTTIGRAACTTSANGEEEGEDPEADAAEQQLYADVTNWEYSGEGPVPPELMWKQQAGALADSLPCATITHNSQIDTSALCCQRLGWSSFQLPGSCRRCCLSTDVPEASRCLLEEGCAVWLVCVAGEVLGYS